MSKFKTGQKFNSTCWFTGGHHTHSIVSRTETEIKCEAIYEESDGTHKVEEEFEISHDDNGEYVVIQSYKGEENRVYAKDLEEA